MGLFLELFKICLFRKCNIFLLIIIVNCLKKKYLRYNKCLKIRKKLMKICIFVFIDYYVMSI